MDRGVSRKGESIVIEETQMSKTMAIRCVECGELLLAGCLIVNFSELSVHLCKL